MARLAAAFQDKTTAPDEWLYSSICREFGCTPLEAPHQPARLTAAIMGLRAYVRAAEKVDAEGESIPVEDWELDLVNEVRQLARQQWP